MPLHNWFLPHKQTHKKAHLISVQAFVVYILIFIGLQVGFSVVEQAKPGLLGVSANIDSTKIIELTNEQRQKMGLGSVKENAQLDQAAKLKAQNMFAENYWAHFSPSGKTPWDFILGSGYKFTYAGENLAKNYYTADDVVAAWMASPTHRDNLLNAKYEDIGIAVEEGVINGQKTVLIVQEFGSTKMLAQAPTVDVSGKQVDVPKADYSNPPSMVASVQTAALPKPLLDPYLFFKSTSLILIFLIAFLLMVDLVVLYRRGVLRLSSHHIAHMAFLSIAATTIISSGPGSIL